MPPAESRIVLPPVPDEFKADPVAAWAEAMAIDTYEVITPEPYPAFLDRRVYQGSSGRVYPLPFFERVATTKKPRLWQALHLENEYLRLVVLPELGGRIHVGLDKTTGYDFFYRNNVIKPAMVGLAGPWISGGVEFNWPQHHRPATQLPVSWEIEYEPDGAVTVWCSDHDPLYRMRSAHGVRLRPGSSLIELRVRLINRTETVQTFLWWANVAARAGDDYQSFFPPDVSMVADHARRATTTFPRADGSYYGVDYPSRVTPERPDGDRLDWYRNIPVPTSYMCVGSSGDFFGGYDHGAGAGFVHWADHRVAPGKKQWTWGDAPFGWAWDRNLSDGDGPYVELMAGVFTDNQPDFSYLAPGETKSFSQYWYPIQQIGPAHQATLEAALSCVLAGRSLRVGVVSTSPRTVTVRLQDETSLHWQSTVAVAPGQPQVLTAVIPDSAIVQDLVVELVTGDVVILRHPLAPGVTPGKVRQAVEPPLPGETRTVDELQHIAVHLAQYRHATRAPEDYWAEMLRRDLAESRANLGLARLDYGRARLDSALARLDQVLARQAAWNTNPIDGEALYLRGLVLTAQDRAAEGYDDFAKAAWDSAWQVPSWLAMARIDLRSGRPVAALEMTGRILALDGFHGQARALQVLASRRLERRLEAVDRLAAARAADRLDWWLADLAGEPVEADAGVIIDVALEYASCGELEAALRCLDAAARRDAEHPLAGLGSQLPLIHLHRADLLSRLDGEAAALAALAAAAQSPAESCFPSRLADALMLLRIRSNFPQATVAAALLGHWLYAHDRHLEAVEQWRVVGDDPVCLRNRGIAAFNVQHDPDEAISCYERALALAPGHSRLWFERDQLAKRVGEAPALRLSRLAERGEAIDARDDLAVEYAGLLLAAGKADQAERFLAGREFQPWEGGEGSVLRAWERTHLTLARRALDRGALHLAQRNLDSAWRLPHTLSEDRHPLANTSELHLLAGDIRAAAGDPSGARLEWKHAADQRGDFIGMEVAAASTRSYASVIALRRLGDNESAALAANALLGSAHQLASKSGAVDYFATSLPNLLLFDEDLGTRNRVTAAVIRAQIAFAMGDLPAAAAEVAEVLKHDPNEPDAIDLATKL